MAKAQQRVMEIERRDLEAIAKRRRAILDRTTHLEKAIKIPNLKQFMWTQSNKTMIGLLRRWRIRRILLRKKIGLLSKVCSFVSNGLENTHA
jgi:hypothetical protein